MILTIACLTARSTTASVMPLRTAFLTAFSTALMAFFLLFFLGTIVPPVAFYKRWMLSLPYSSSPYGSLRYAS